MKQNQIDQIYLDGYNTCITQYKSMSFVLIVFRCLENRVEVSRILPKKTEVYLIIT